MTIKLNECYDEELVKELAGMCSKAYFDVGYSYDSAIALRRSLSKEDRIRFDDALRIILAHVYPDCHHCNYIDAMPVHYCLAYLVVREKAVFIGTNALTPLEQLQLQWVGTIVDVDWTVSLSGSKFIDDTAWKGKKVLDIRWLISGEYVAIVEDFLCSPVRVERLKLVTNKPTTTMNQYLSTVLWSASR